METIFSDVLVIGAGAAAARAAVEAAASGVRVDLVDKGEFGNSGSSVPCLQGIATTFNEEDSPEQFFNDWMRSSGSISDQNLVWEAITQSRRAVESLEVMGLPFITNADGSRLLYRGAGHSAARGLTTKFHLAEGPNTVTILRAEATKRGVHIHEGIMIARLLQEDNRVIGAIGISRKKELTAFSAKAVVLAAGGANWIYPNAAHLIADPRFHTTGDSFYLAFTAGAPLIDLEFTQYRDSPPGGARYGGKYFNALGARFMEKYDPKNLEKAPRAKVVEAIYKETKAGRGPIKWQVEGIREAEIANMLTTAKLYAGRQWIEVSIDFQRVLGGAKINERAETPIPGLFAAGESSGGVQGAGRMQGGGFLETQVFGTNAGKNAAALALNTERNSCGPAPIREEEARIARIKGNEDPVKITQTVQKIMWNQVGVVREGAELKDAIAKFEQLRNEIIPRLSGDDIFAALEAAHLQLAAEMIAKAALTREESRGAHVRSDYPDSNDDKWLKHVCITNEGGEIAISTIPVVKREK